MSTNDVIDAYLADVMRRLPRKDRNEVGLELRGLLAEMLAERAVGESRADDAAVLAMLRAFGTPAEVAARYRPPGMVIIPPEQSRSFAVMSLVGIALQWALTLPGVFHGLPLTGWWFTWGLGALWWPGFLAMMALAAAWLRHAGIARDSWRPRVVDPARIDRGTMGFGLAGYAIGVAIMVGLPWIARAIPAPLPQLFVFSPDFLPGRAWPALVLWAGHFALLASVLAKGRWSIGARRLEACFSLGWLALLSWWLVAGPIFRTASVNDGARGGIGLVLLIVVADLAFKLYRRQARIRPPIAAG